MEKPLFSIIIPTLNEEKFLPKLLDSLIAQSDKDFEVIVVDGASVDKTEEVAQSYSKRVPNLSIVRAGKAGVSYQKNLGAARAVGEWVAFVDADVIFPYKEESAKSLVFNLLQYFYDGTPTKMVALNTPRHFRNDDGIVHLFSNLFLNLLC